MKRLLLLLAAVAALALPTSAPAFHHVFLPGGACGESENSGGGNLTARAALIAAGHSLPLPPVGTAAADHSPNISNTPGVECPAPQK
jgi:hypothetical protein